MIKSAVCLFVLILNLLNAQAGEFGEYKYSKYIALQQSLQAQRAANQRLQMSYNSNSARNIRYPSANNPYPNITKNTPKPTGYYRF